MAASKSVIAAANAVASSIKSGSSSGSSAAKTAVSAGKTIIPAASKILGSKASETANKVLGHISSSSDDDEEKEKWAGSLGSDETAEDTSSAEENTEETPVEVETETPDITGTTVDTPKSPDLTQVNVGILSKGASIIANNERQRRQSANDAADSLHAENAEKAGISEFEMYGSTYGKGKEKFYTGKSSDTDEPEYTEGTDYVTSLAAYGGGEKAPGAQFFGAGGFTQAQENKIAAAGTTAEKTDALIDIANTALDDLYNVSDTITTKDGKTYFSGVKDGTTIDTCKSIYDPLAKVATTIEDTYLNEHCVVTITGKDSTNPTKIVLPDEIANSSTGKIVKVEVVPVEDKSGNVIGNGYKITYEPSDSLKSVYGSDYTETYTSGVQPELANYNSTDSVDFYYGYKEDAGDSVREYYQGVVDTLWSNAHLAQSYAQKIDYDERGHNQIGESQLEASYGQARINAQNNLQTAESYVSAFEAARQEIGYLDDNPSSLQVFNSQRAIYAEALGLPTEEAKTAEEAKALIEKDKTAVGNNAKSAREESNRAEAAYNNAKNALDTTNAQNRILYDYKVDVDDNIAVGEFLVEEQNRIDKINQNTNLSEEEKASQIEDVNQEIDLIKEYQTYKKFGNAGVPYDTVSSIVDARKYFFEPDSEGNVRTTISTDLSEFGGNIDLSESNVDLTKTAIISKNGLFVVVPEVSPMGKNSSEYMAKNTDNYNRTGKCFGVFSSYAEAKDYADSLPDNKYIQYSLAYEAYDTYNAQWHMYDEQLNNLQSGATYEVVNEETGETHALTPEEIQARGEVLVKARDAAKEKAEEAKETLESLSDYSVYTPSESMKVEYNTLASISASNQQKYDLTEREYDTLGGLKISDCLLNYSETVDGEYDSDGNPKRQKTNKTLGSVEDMISMSSNAVDSKQSFYNKVVEAVNSGELSYELEQSLISKYGINAVNELKETIENHRQDWRDTTIAKELTSDLSNAKEELSILKSLTGIDAESDPNYDNAMYLGTKILGQVRNPELDDKERINLFAKLVSEDYRDDLGYSGLTMTSDELDELQTLQTKKDKSDEDASFAFTAEEYERYEYLTKKLASSENDLGKYMNLIISGRTDDDLVLPTDNWSQYELDTFAYLVGSGRIDRAVDYAIQENTLYKNTEKETREQEILAKKKALGKAMFEADGFVDRMAAWGEATLDTAVSGLATALGIGFIQSCSDIPYFVKTGRLPVTASLSLMEKADATISGITQGIDGHGSFLGKDYSWYYQGISSSITSLETITAAGAVATAATTIAAPTLAALGIESAASLAAISSFVQNAYVNLAFFGPSAIQGMEEAYNRGVSPKQAATIGIINGAFEGLFEMVSLDKLIHASAGKGFASFIKSALIQGGIEGSEEFNTAVANYIADTLVNTDMSEVQVRIRELEEYGYSKEDAEKQAYHELQESIYDATLQGAFSGGLDSVMRVVPNVRNSYNRGKALVENDGLDLTMADYLLSASENNPELVKGKDSGNVIDKGLQYVSSFLFNSDISDTGKLLSDAQEIKNIAEGRKADAEKYQNNIDAALTEMQDSDNTAALEVRINNNRIYLNESQKRGNGKFGKYLRASNLEREFKQVAPQLYARFVAENYESFGKFDTTTVLKSFKDITDEWTSNADCVDYANARFGTVSETGDIDNLVYSVISPIVVSVSHNLSNADGTVDRIAKEQPTLLGIISGSTGVDASDVLKCAENLTTGNESEDEKIRAAFASYFNGLAKEGKLEIASKNSANIVRGEGVGKWLGSVCDWVSNVSKGAYKKGSHTITEFTSDMPLEDMLGYVWAFYRNVYVENSKTSNEAAIEEANKYMEANGVTVNASGQSIIPAKNDTNGFNGRWGLTQHFTARPRVTNSSEQGNAEEGKANGATSAKERKASKIKRNNYAAMGPYIKYLPEKYRSIEIRLPGGRTYSAFLYYSMRVDSDPSITAEQAMKEFELIAQGYSFEDAKAKAKEMFGSYESKRQEITAKLKELDEKIAEVEKNIEAAKLAKDTDIAYLDEATNSQNKEDADKYAALVKQKTEEIKKLEDELKSLKEQRKELSEKLKQYEKPEIQKAKDEIKKEGYADESAVPINGFKDAYRSDKDSITVNGKTITRKEFVDSFNKEGKDADAEFDKLLVNTVKAGLESGKAFLGNKENNGKPMLPKVSKEDIEKEKLASEERVKAQKAEATSPERVLRNERRKLNEQLKAAAAEEEKAKKAYDKALADLSKLTDEDIFDPEKYEELHKIYTDASTAWVEAGKKTAEAQVALDENKKAIEAEMKSKEETLPSTPVTEDTHTVSTYCQRLADYESHIVLIDGEITNILNEFGITREQFDKDKESHKKSTLPEKFIKAGLPRIKVLTIELTNYQKLVDALSKQIAELRQKQDEATLGEDEAKLMHEMSETEKTLAAIAEDIETKQKEEAELKSKKDTLEKEVEDLKNKRKETTDKAKTEGKKADTSELTKQINAKKSELKRTLEKLAVKSATIVDLTKREAEVRENLRVLDVNFVSEHNEAAVKILLAQKDTMQTDLDYAIVHVEELEDEYARTSNADTRAELMLYRRRATYLSRQIADIVKAVNTDPSTLADKFSENKSYEEWAKVAKEDLNTEIERIKGAIKNQELVVKNRTEEYQNVSSEENKDTYSPETIQEAKNELAQAKAELEILKANLNRTQYEYNRLFGQKGNENGATTDSNERQLALDGQTAGRTSESDGTEGDNEQPDVHVFGGTKVRLTEGSVILSDEDLTEQQKKLKAQYLELGGKEIVFVKGRIVSKYKKPDGTFALSNGEAINTFRGKGDSANSSVLIITLDDGIHPTTMSTEEIFGHESGHFTMAPLDAVYLNGEVVSIRASFIKAAVNYIFNNNPGITTAAIEPYMGEYGNFHLASLGRPATIADVKAAEAKAEEEFLMDAIGGVNRYKNKGALVSASACHDYAMDFLKENDFYEFIKSQWNNTTYNTEKRCKENGGRFFNVSKFVAKANTSSDDTAAQSETTQTTQDTQTEATQSVANPMKTFPKEYPTIEAETTRFGKAHGMTITKTLTDEQVDMFTKNKVGHFTPAYKADDIIRNIQNTITNDAVERFGYSAFSDRTYDEAKAYFTALDSLYKALGFQLDFSTIRYSDGKSKNLMSGWGIDVVPYTEAERLADETSRARNELPQGTSDDYSYESFYTGLGVEAVYNVTYIDSKTGETKTTPMTYAQWKAMKFGADLSDETEADLAFTFNKQVASFAGFTRDGGETVLDGKSDGQTLTIEDVKKSPLGQIVAMADDDVDKEAEYELLVQIANMMASYKDQNLVWEIVGTSLMSSIKKNSDTQYNKTLDFSTVCKKTQQILDGISYVMDQLKRGLTKDEIITAYYEVGKAGQATPCPVCYVFARWFGAGSTIQTINECQKLYGEKAGDQAEGNINSLLVQIDEIIDGRVAHNKSKAKVDKKTGELKTPGEGKTRSKLLDDARQQALKDAEKANSALKWHELHVMTYNNLLNKSDKELTKEQKSQLNSLKKELEAYAKTNGANERATYEKAEATVKAIDHYKWLMKARLTSAEEGQTADFFDINGNGMVYNQEYNDVSDATLFDLRAADKFMQESPANWKFKNSKASSGGKAILPYADARPFEALQQLAKANANGLPDAHNTLLEGDEAGTEKILKRARKLQKAQNLIGGLRFQSTSDFRYEWTSDYLMTLLEVQAARGNVQLYTKVIEAVDFLASAGCDVNLSVMPKGCGYTKDENGNLVLDFSSVTGINHAAAIKMKNKYDNVQLIMVGINETHIRLCMEDNDIQFIIPYHASGNSRETLHDLMALLGEDIDMDAIKDFSEYQTDVIPKSESQRANWEMRCNIISGKLADVTEDEKGNEIATLKELDDKELEILKHNKWLRDLYRRFYLDKPTADGRSVECVDQKHPVMQMYYVTDDLGNVLHDAEGNPKTDSADYKKRYFIDGEGNDCYLNFLPLSVKEEEEEDADGNKSKKKTDKGPASQIFPYEYWDKSSTIENAKDNGQAFLDYCKTMGVVPRFTGIGKKGKYNAQYDFSHKLGANGKVTTEISDGYWKLLIDRPMYDNNGNYRSQKKIDVSRIEIGDVMNLTGPNIENNFGEDSKFHSELDLEAQESYTSEYRDDDSSPYYNPKERKDYTKNIVSRANDKSRNEEIGKAILARIENGTSYDGNLQKFMDQSTNVAFERGDTETGLAMAAEQYEDEVHLSLDGFTSEDHDEAIDLDYMTSGEDIFPDDYSDNERFSITVDENTRHLGPDGELIDTLDFLNGQLARGEVTKVYKALLEITDPETGETHLYAPMASVKTNEDGTKVLSHGLTPEKWEMSEGNPNSRSIVRDADGNPIIYTDKDGRRYWKFNLLKDNGTVCPAAYNPYQHGSDRVNNDQFVTYYKRGNIVVYECYIPNSELESEYKAEGAKDEVGLHDWKAGDLARKLSSKRHVYLSRWLMPVRKLADSEVASMFKDMMDEEDHEIPVPFNVVAPGVLTELEKLNVAIDYDGSSTYVTHGNPTAHRCRKAYNVLFVPFKYSGKENEDYIPRKLENAKKRNDTKAIRKYEDQLKAAMEEYEDAIAEYKAEKGVDFQYEGRTTKLRDDFLNQEELKKLNDTIRKKTIVANNESESEKTRSNARKAVEKAENKLSELRAPYEGTVIEHTPRTWEVKHNAINDVVLNESDEDSENYSLEQTSMSAEEKALQYNPDNAFNKLMDNFDYKAATKVMQDVSYWKKTRAYPNYYSQEDRVEKILSEDEIERMIIDGTYDGSEPLSFADSDSYNDDQLRELYSLEAFTTFSGTGTIDFALRGALDTIAAVEFDDTLAPYYLQNNQVRNPYLGRSQGDIRNVDFSDPKFWNLDYFHASPVCHDYSLLNNYRDQMADNDDDITTAEAVANAIRVASPKVITIENVPGYIGSEALKIITDALEECGYLHDGGRVYNSADYGAATSRDRMFLRAIRSDVLAVQDIKYEDLFKEPTKLQHHVGWGEVVSPEEFRTYEELDPYHPKLVTGINPRMIESLRDVDGLDVINWTYTDKNGKTMPMKDEPLFAFGESTADKSFRPTFADEPVPSIPAESGRSIIFERVDGVTHAYLVDPVFLAKVSGLVDKDGNPMKLSRDFVNSEEFAERTKHLVTNGDNPRPLKFFKKDGTPKSSVTNDRKVIGNGVPGNLTKAVVGSFLSRVFPEENVESKLGINSEEGRYSLEEFYPELNGLSYSELSQKEMEVNSELKSAQNLLREMKDDAELKELNDILMELFSKARTATSGEDKAEIKVQMESVMNDIASRETDLGLKEQSDKVYELNRRVTEIRKAEDVAYEREGRERENAEIEKSGLTAEEYFRKKAIKEFGTTTDFREAGYLLPNGTMLNFCGSKGEHRGVRGDDHRQIGVIYEATQNTAALNRFLNDGNIRIMAESPGIDLPKDHEPTKEQYAKIRSMINTIGKNNEAFYIDYSTADGYRDASNDYEGKISADKILSDIKYYYENGGAREQSDVAKFHGMYSLEDTSDYAPEFYSKLSRVMDDPKTPNKIGTDQLEKYLLGKGVKAEEIKWSGLYQYLADKLDEGSKNVTKEDVKAFLAENPFHLDKEVLTQYDEKYLNDISDKADDANISFWTAYAEIYGEPSMYDEFDISSVDPSELSFLDANSDDYDSNLANNFYNARKLYGELNSIKIKYTRWSDYTTSGVSNYREYKYKMPNSEYKNAAMHTHWGDSGVLIHARLGEINSDSSMLFVEEIQSDWHNQGVKNGYSETSFEDNIEEEFQSRIHTKDELDFDVSDYGQYGNEYRATIKYKGRNVVYSDGWFNLGGFGETREEAKENAYKRYLDNRGVVETYSYGRIENRVKAPDAPFKKGKYIEYVLKDLLREAAETGVDRLAWTSGKMQEDRWSDEYAEGYRIEYDQDIPKFLKKFGKQFGATLEDVLLDSGDMAHSMTITDSMRNSVLYEGQEMFSLEDYGYHAGDLGKSAGDDYFGQSGLRGTGHFGFGTYFVGNTAKLSGDYASRPIEKVDFSNYNLLKISDDEQGYRLHDALKELDGKLSKWGIHIPGDDIESLAKKAGDVEWLLHSYGRDDSDYIDGMKAGRRLLNIAKSVHPNAFYTSDMKAEELYNLANRPDVNEDDREKLTQESQSYRDDFLKRYPDARFAKTVEEEVESEMESLQSRIDDVREAFHDMTKEEIQFSIMEFEKDANSLYDYIDAVKDFNESIVRDLSSGLNFEKSNSEIKAALNEARDTIAEYDPYERGLDSASTVFMKSLGYEGVDVRGTALDNTTYGSVIYDLKGKDLERKSEIGTARYSLDGNSFVFNNTPAFVGMFDNNSGEIVATRDAETALRNNLSGNMFADDMDIYRRWLNDETTMFRVDDGNVIIDNLGHSIESYGDVPKMVADQIKGVNGEYIGWAGNDRYSLDPTATGDDLFGPGTFNSALYDAIRTGNYTRLTNEINAHLGIENPDNPDDPNNPNNPKPKPGQIVIPAYNRISDAEKRLIDAKNQELLDRYGALERGENPFRDVLVPKKYDDIHNARRAYRTIREAESTPEWMEELMDKKALTDEVAARYTQISDASAIKAAERRFAATGDLKKNTDRWNGIVASGARVTKDDIAYGTKVLQENAMAGDIDATMKAVCDLSMLGTELGQAVQAFRLIKKMKPEGQLYYCQQLADRLNRQYEKQIEKGKMEPIKINQAIADRVMAANTRKELDDAMKELKEDMASHLPVTLMDQWNAWRMLSMLGNLKTHIRNFLGNAGFMPSIAIKNAMASTMERMFVKEEDRTKSFGRLGIPSVYMEFAKSDFDVMQDVITGNGKYNPKTEIMSMRKIFQQGPIKSKALQWLSDFNGKKLEQEDQIFMKRHYVTALAGFLNARHIDMNNIMTPAGYKELNEAREYAVLEAQKATYRDYSALASMLSRIKSSGGVAGFLIDGVVPFTKTPINIAKRGILEYSPIGVARGLADTIFRRDDTTAAERIDMLCSGLSGSMVFALGYWLARTGIAVLGVGVQLIGAGSGDDDKDDEDEAQGKQDYSIELTLPDGRVLSYTMDWLSPISLPLFSGVAAYTGEIFSDPNVFNMIDAMAQLMEPMTDLSMLSGISNLFNSMSYADENARLSTLGWGIASSYLAQGLPTIGSQLARTLDPYTRTTYVDKNQYDGTAASAWTRFIQSSILGKIPGLSDNRIAKVDAWGRTIQDDNVLSRAIENFLSPGYYNWKNTTDVDIELERLVGVLGDTSLYPSTAEKYFNVDLDGDGITERKDLTAEEYESYAIDKGQTALQILTEIIHDPQYQSLVDDPNAQAEIIQTAYEYAGQKARADLTEGKYEVESWVDKAEEFGISDYIILKSDINDATSQQKLLNLVTNSNNISTQQQGILLAQRFNADDTLVNSANIGYNYVLTDDDKEAEELLYRGLFVDAYVQMADSDEWKTSSDDERYEMYLELKDDVKLLTKNQFSNTLATQGRTADVLRSGSSVRASTNYNTMYYVAFTSDMSISEQAQWIIDGTAYSTYLTKEGREIQKQMFSEQFPAAYKELVTSDSWKAKDSQGKAAAIYNLSSNMRSSIYKQLKSQYYGRSSKTGDEAEIKATSENPNDNPYINMDYDYNS